MSEYRVRDISTDSLCHTILNHKDIPPYLNQYSIIVRKIPNGIEAIDHYYIC